MEKVKDRYVYNLHGREKVKNDVNIDNGELLKVISRSGVTTILYTLRKSPQRFSQLIFSTKLNPGILNRHLKALMKFNLVTKSDNSYVLTSKGEKVVSIIDQIIKLSKS